MKTTEKIIGVFWILSLFVHTDCCPVLLGNVRSSFLIFSKIKIVYSVFIWDKIQDQDGGQGNEVRVYLIYQENWANEADL